MKEDLLRHALTASLAALLASAGTAFVLVDRQPQGSATPPTPIASRDDGGSDERLVEALGRVESALSGLQMSVEQAASRERREVVVAAPPSAPRERVEASARGAAEAATGESDAPDGLEAASPGTVRPVDVVAVEAVLRRLDSYNAKGVKEPDLHPARSYYLRSVSDIVRELGPPTSSRTIDSGFRALWKVPGDRYVSLEFVDGICVEFRGR